MSSASKKSKTTHTLKYARQIQQSAILCTNCLRLGYINPLNAELNPICHLLALLGAHPILHISRIRVNNISNLDLA